MIDTYEIRPDYIHRTEPPPFDDRENEADYQFSVYLDALSLMTLCGFKSVTDIGCGSGYKLVNMLGKFKIQGLDIEPTVSFLRRKYPAHQWLDFNCTELSRLKSDLVLCVDTIEHVNNPDMFLRQLAAIPANLFLLSTPERDLVRGPDDPGPPKNIHHFREWDSTEFKRLVSRHFKIITHVLRDGQTQLVMATLK